MFGFLETMRRREKAEEDIYFARIDRQLIQAWRRRRKSQSEQVAQQPLKQGRPNQDK